MPTSVRKRISNEMPDSQRREPRRWELVRCVHSGPQSRVYLAHPKIADSKPSAAEKADAAYVVKLFALEDDLAMFRARREARVGSTVSHPNVVPVLACDLADKPFHLVMPRLEGAILSDVIRVAQHLPLPRVFWITRQIAQGLAALHRAGWTHGDVKPENIMVSFAGHTTLIDLGFSSPIGSVMQATEPLRTTLAYAAPESFAGQQMVDGSSDIYSLGIVLYRLLTGRLPYDSADEQSLARAHLEQLPPSPRSVNPAIPSQATKLLQRLIAKQPLRRPTSDELVHWLFKLEIDSLRSAA